MIKKFQKANEKNVKAVVFYGKSADKKLYYESTYTTQVTQDDLQNAFAKGMCTIVDGTTWLRPVACTTNTCKTITPNTSTATSADLVTWTAQAAE